MHQQTYEQRRGTPAERGYGPEYQLNRLVLLADAEVCYWCGEPPADDDPLTADHMVRVEDGGSSALENLVPAHYSCNSGRR